MAAHIDATVAEAIKQQRLAASGEAIVSEAQLEALQIRLDALHSAQLLEVRCGERRKDFQLSVLVRFVPSLSWQIIVSFIGTIPN